MIIAVIVGSAVLGIAPLFYSYVADYRFERSLSALGQNPSISDTEAKEYIAHVRGADNIPQDETPTAVRVTDASPLASFGDVRRGDVILLYRTAGLAVVYDPISQRLINAVSVNIRSQDGR